MCAQTHVQSFILHTLSNLGIPYNFGKKNLGILYIFSKINSGINKKKRIFASETRYQYARVQSIQTKDLQRDASLEAKQAGQNSPID